MRQADAEGLQILGLTLLAGRWLDGRDEFLPRSIRSELGLDQAGEDAAIVNETLATRLWSRQTALGRTLHVAGAGDRTVVGVVSDVRESADRLEVQPTVYLPPSVQYVRPSFVIRLREGRGSGPAFVSQVRDALAAGVPMVHLRNVRPLADVSLDSQRNVILALRLLMSFAATGLFVAGLGVYAVAGEAATARRRETAVRMALGATGGQVLRLALVRNVRLILMALPFGVAGSWVTAHLLSHTLLKIEPGDLSLRLWPVAILAATVLAAAIRPAWRASALDPARALAMPDR